MRTILAADIGGTNSRFAHFQTGPETHLELVGTQWLPTTEAQSFTELLRQLKENAFSLTPETADITVLAIAGPVEGKTYCAPPYISWDIDLDRDNKTGFLGRVSLINDFVAQAYACRSPIGESARPVLSGERILDATIGVLGAGTGLGKATLVPVSGDEYLALPSEGGHAFFPFQTQREFAFQDFYRGKSGNKHITGNLVLSGNGLRHLHWFLSGEDLAPQAITARFAEGKNSETLAWAASFYGRVCRDYALEILARGGLYIAGGMAARNPELVTHENFRQEFLDSPTMGDILKKIPVFLMDNQDSGLWGAAFYGRQLLLHP